MTDQLSTRTHRFANGLTLVAEPMPEKQTAAWMFLLPVGAANEPAHLSGISTVLEGACYRGAGERDSREFSDALDDLGVDRSGGVAVEYSTFGGGALGESLPEILPLYADLMLRPHFPAGEWEGQRELALQNLASLEDQPAQKMFQELRKIYFPGPHGRSSLGTEEGLSQLTRGDLINDHANRFKPAGAILAVAGHVDFEALAAQIGQLFGDWQGAAPPLPAPEIIAAPATRHIAQDIAQEHIGVAWKGLALDHPHYYDHRVAMAILSGGMGARLFTEVREKRGLVYTVHAGAYLYRGCGFNLAYAGTTAERSQETLDVLLQELIKIARGVTEEEVERAKIGMLSNLVMGEESSRSRTSSMASDMFQLGRVRPLDETTSQLEKVTAQSIQKYFDAFPPGDFTVLTLGPQELSHS
jgi:predicted Zn-dependent peptidase